MPELCTRCKKADAHRYIGRSRFCEACYASWRTERCEGTVFSPRVWHHKCALKGVEEVAGKRYCRRHAEQQRQFIAKQERWRTNH